MSDKSKEYSILIVDDLELNIAALSDILKNDYTLYVTKNGHEAVACAEKFLPTVIVLDIVMEGMDGYEVLTRLKQNEKTKDIPVIFATVLMRDEDEAKGLALGAADYIVKPFSPHIVRLRVQNQIKIVRQLHLIMENEVNERLTRARSDFLSRMSQEMRTPMNTIIGHAAVAKRTSDEGVRDECIEQIDDESRYLLRILNDVHDIDAIERGALELAATAFCPAELMKSAAEAMRPNFDEKDQTLTYICDPKLPDKVLGDPKRINQVVYHLLSNANIFTPRQGTIQLKMVTLGCEDDIHTLKIEVIDNGIGISREHKKRLFSPFEQADDSMSRSYRGAGLGLALSKHIVELMGGKIWIESQVGRGTIATFTLRTKATV